MSESRNKVADAIIGQIEDRFPNWRSYRDLLDCIDCTLHDLRSETRYRAAAIDALELPAKAAGDGVDLHDVTRAIYDIAPSFSYDECEAIARSLLAQYRIAALDREEIGAADVDPIEQHLIARNRTDTLARAGIRSEETQSSDGGVEGHAGDATQATGSAVTSAPPTSGDKISPIGLLAAGIKPGPSEPTFGCKRAGGFVDTSCTAACDCDKTQRLDRPSEPSAPSKRDEPVQDTWFTDAKLPVMAMSGDVESDRVLKLHFRRKVTDQDRIDLTDALNMKLHPRTVDAEAIEPIIVAWADAEEFELTIRQVHALATAISQLIAGER